MVNVISSTKADAARRRAFASNMEFMTAKVAAMKAAEAYREETNANSLTNPDKAKTGERN